MLSGQNDVVSWVDNTDQDDAVSYPHPHPHALSHLPLDCHDWYVTGGNFIYTPLPLLPPPLHHQPSSLCPPLVNPFDPSASFNFPPDQNFIGPGPGPGLDTEFNGGMSFSGLESFDPTQTPKFLMPLEIGPGPGTRPTLFERRVLGKRRREAEEGEEEGGGSLGGTMVNYYDSENENNNGGGSEFNYEYGEGNSNANSGVTGGGGGGSGEANNNGKGKRKGGMPAKNLMAERRRRKKLNDRLYMLRSVVPKISKVRFICSFRWPGYTMT